VHAWVQDTKSDSEAPRVNGRLKGHARPDSRVRDAEEFELEGLMSGDEDAEPVESKEIDS
jgi:hypothetical protein